MRCCPALLLALVTAGALGCDAPPAWRWDPARAPCAGSGDEERWMCGPQNPYWPADVAEPSASCHATLCLAGWGYDYSDGNDYLEGACPTLPGLVEYCPGDEPCRAVFYDVAAARDALRAVTERAREQDTPCPVSVVAHSWGTFDAVELFGELAERDGAAVDRFVTLDPYRAFPPPALDVPAGVGATRNFFRPARADDCSKDWGGFDGRPIGCAASQDCRQVNLLEIAGEDPGHCSMIWTVWPRVVPFVAEGADAPLPFGEVDVERR